MIRGSKGTVYGGGGLEDPSVGVLLSPFEFRQGRVNLEPKKHKGGG
jgi:hypothetical protein